MATSWADTGDMACRGRARRRRSCAVAGLLALVVVAAPGKGVAEPTTADRAIAERLYEQGRKQRDKGDVATACESFAESQRLDPGTGTLLNLAACHETLGKLASAWVELREALAASRREKRTDRVRFALEHLAAIEPRLAYVTIAVPAWPAGQAPVVTLDGRELGPAAWGVAIPVDAGAHETVVRRGDAPPWRAVVDIHDGERRQVEVPGRSARGPTGTDVPARRADDTPQAGRAEPLVAPVGAPVVERAPDKPAEGSTPPSRGRVAALVLGGVGLAAVGVGTYFALHAADLWSERNRACPMEACSRDGVMLGSRADTAATVATWTIAGGAGALGAAVLWLLWPRTDSSGRSVVGIRVDGPKQLALVGMF